MSNTADLGFQTVSEVAPFPLELLGRTETRSSICIIANACRSWIGKLLTLCGDDVQFSKTMDMLEDDVRSLLGVFAKAMSARGLMLWCNQKLGTTAQSSRTQKSRSGDGRMWCRVGWIRFAILVRTSVEFIPENDAIIRPNLLWWMLEAKSLSTSFAAS